MKNQHGYTLFELLFLLAVIAIIGSFGAVMFTAIHFLSKVW